MKILAKSDCSITADTKDFVLGDYTVFAGENNAGKTHLIKAVIDELQKVESNIIYIPAERVTVSEELKKGADKNPLKKSLAQLIKIEGIGKIKPITNIENAETELPEIFSEFGVEKTSIKIAHKEKLTELEYENAIKEAVMTKLFDSITIDDGYNGKTGIKPSEVGQGTERLIIVALLRYLEEKKFVKNNKLDKPTYLVIEEPEIYLHPKLKLSFQKTLTNLSKLKGLKIIITTHDPCFIEFNHDKKIIKVYRNKNKKFSTDIEIIDQNQRILTFPSHSEINYLIFGVSHPSYYLELFQFLMESATKRFKWEKNYYDQFDEFLKNELKVVQKYPHDSKNVKMTYLTRMRHDIAHPTTDGIKRDLTSKLDEGIKRLLEIAGKLKT
jgi:AAA15 family ATPase/GTPase